MTSSADPAQSNAADEWAIRQLVERYAGAADRADGEAVAALFTATGELALWLDPTSTESVVRNGSEEIATAISKLAAQQATQHVIANSVASIDGDTATGETRCTAHHLGADGTDHVLFIRYDDRFIRVDGRWLIARRELRVQWSTVAGPRASAGEPVLDRATGGDLG